MGRAKTAYIKVLDNVTGTDSSTAYEVEGDFLVIIRGTTIGTVTFKASSDGTTYTALTEGAFTEETAKNISLPPCWIQVDYDSSTGVTVEMLPFRRD